MGGVEGLTMENSTVEGTTVEGSVQGGGGGGSAYPDIDQFVSDGSTKISSLNNPYSLFIKPDGTRMYTGRGDSGYFQWDFGTPWDRNTVGAPVASGISQGGQVSILLSTDGALAYSLGDFSASVGSFQVNVLTTPWDITSVDSNTRKSNMSVNPTVMFGFWVGADGQSVYIGGTNTLSPSTAIYAYTMATPNNGSTLDSGTLSLDVSSEIGSGFRSFIFTPDGLKLFVCDTDTDTIFQWDVATPFDLTTATYSGKSLNTTSSPGDPRGLYLRTDGALTLFVAGGGNSGTYLQEFSVP